MRKIYIASRWMAQPRLREVVKRLDGMLEVTSRWIHVDRPEDPTAEFFQEHGKERAVIDVLDVQRADWLVLDLLDGRGRRGGYMFEAGLAMGLGKPVILVGEADCVFTQLFQRYDNWDEYVAYLKLYPNGRVAAADKAVDTRRHFYAPVETGGLCADCGQYKRIGNHL